MTAAAAPSLFTAKKNFHVADWIGLDCNGSLVGSDERMQMAASLLALPLSTEQNSLTDSLALNSAAAAVAAHKVKQGRVCR